ncbi:MAG: ribose 5-phosphate isomerase B [Bacteroidota bacterium]
MNNKWIGIASDHAGYLLKQAIKSFLEENGYEVKDYGTFSDERTDYPDFGHALGNAIDTGECIEAIAICGSGNGINMTLNKHKKVRAALCWNEEIAVLAREHNDANVCTLPGRFISINEATKIIKTFLNTDFESGRHSARVQKIPIK